MNIITHRCNTPSLDEVKKLLESNHHLRRFNDLNISDGEQAEGDYCVFSLTVFWGRRKVRNVHRARITVHDVLEACSAGNPTNVDGLVHGPFCDAIVDAISDEFGWDGMWSKESEGSSVVWLVTHRFRVQKYMWLNKDRHRHLVKLDPTCTPHCDMWLMIGGPGSEATPIPVAATSERSFLSTQAHLSAAVPATSPPFRPPENKISLNPPSKNAHKCSTLSSGSAIQSHTSTAVASATLQSGFQNYLAGPSTSGYIPTQQPSKSKTQGPAQSTAQQPAERYAQTVSQDSHPESPALPIKSCHAKSSSRKAPPKELFQLQNMKNLKESNKVNVACVVAEVKKLARRCKNNNIYDVVSICSKDITFPSSRQPSMNVNIFHNDGTDWPPGIEPERGQVWLIREMKIGKFNNFLDGIVFSTKMICIYTMDEMDQLKAFPQANARWIPDNIRGAEAAALDMFEWWQKEGKAQIHTIDNVTSHVRAPAPSPLCLLCNVEETRVIKLTCMVVDLKIYEHPKDPKCVMRVTDGNPTKSCFQDIVGDPKECNDSEQMFGNLGSLEVDILVSLRQVLPCLRSLVKGSYIELFELECEKIKEGHFALYIHSSARAKPFFRVLDNNDPAAETIKKALAQNLGPELEEDDDDDDGSEDNGMDDDTVEPRDVMQSTQKQCSGENNMSINDSLDKCMGELNSEWFTTQHTRESESQSRKCDVDQRQFESSPSKKKCLDPIDPTNTALNTYTGPSTSSRKLPCSPFRQQHLLSPKQPSADVLKPPHIHNLLPVSAQSPSRVSSNSPSPQSSPVPSKHLQHCSPQSSPSLLASIQDHEHTSLHSPSTSEHSTHASSQHHTSHDAQKQYSSPHKLKESPMSSSSSSGSHTFSHSPLMLQKPVYASSTPRTPTTQSSLPSSPPELSSTLKQSAHPSSPRPQQHTPTPSRQLFHPTFLKPSTLRLATSLNPLNTPGGAVSKRQVQEDQVDKTESASSCHGPRMLERSFYTETYDVKQKVSLENFYTFGKIGEVYSVKAAIVDILSIKQKDCIFPEEHVCLHQWLWAVCRKCRLHFSSNFLTHHSTFRILDSQDSTSPASLPCWYCTHHCTKGGSGAELSSLESNTLMPFMKVKLVIQDPDTGLQLNPWLLADSANTFFNTTPTFGWLFREPEIQGTIEELLKHNTLPLELALKKTLIDGRLQLYLVNTRMFMTPSYSSVLPSDAEASNNINQHISNAPQNLTPESPLSPESSPPINQPAPASSTPSTTSQKDSTTARTPPASTQDPAGPCISSKISHTHPYKIHRHITLTSSSSPSSSPTTSPIKQTKTPSHPDSNPTIPTKQPQTSSQPDFNLSSPSYKTPMSSPTRQNKTNSQHHSNSTSPTKQTKTSSSQPDSNSTTPTIQPRTDSQHDSNPTTPSKQLITLSPQPTSPKTSAKHPETPYEVFSSPTKPKIPFQLSNLKTPTKHLKSPSQQPSSPTTSTDHPETLVQPHSSASQSSLNLIAPTKPNISPSQPNPSPSTSNQPESDSSSPKPNLVSRKRKPSPPSSPTTRTKSKKLAALSSCPSMSTRSKQL